MLFRTHRVGLSPPLLVGLLSLLAACSVTAVDDPFADGAGQGARVSKLVDGSRDVELRLENGATLEVPEGAVQRATDVSLARMSDERASQLIGQVRPAVRAIGAPHVLTPHGSQFVREIELTLPSTAQPRSREQIEVLWLEDESDRKWKRLRDVDVRNGMVRVHLNHFSVVMLAEVEQSVELEDVPDVVIDAGADLPVPDAAADDAGVLPPATDAGRGDPGSQPAAVWNGVLIQQLGSSASDFVSKPHSVRLVSAEDGTPLDTPVTAITGSDGRFRLQPPEVREYWVQVAGDGPASEQESTYDSLTLWTPGSGDSLVRIGFVGTAATPEITGGYTSRFDHVAVQGAVYRVDSSGRRIGTVGCAKIYLDDLPSPALSADQRYIQGVLPTTLTQRDLTQRSGKWHFGNLTPGLHTFKVTLDEGRTFLAEKTVYIPFARRDALGAFKSMLVFMGIDVPGPDPTPASCPVDE